MLGEGLPYSFKNYAIRNRLDIDFSFEESYLRHSTYCILGFEGTRLQHSAVRNINCRIYESSCRNEANAYFRWARIFAQSKILSKSSHLKLADVRPIITWWFTQMAWMARNAYSREAIHSHFGHHSPTSGIQWAAIPSCCGCNMHRSDVVYSYGDSQGRARALPLIEYHIIIGKAMCCNASWWIMHGGLFSVI